MNISAAHVSAYAEMFGSEYGSPKPPLPVDPMPPVTYIFRSTAPVHIRIAAFRYPSAPVSTPTSASDTISLVPFTAWPTAALCSSTGLYDWVWRPLLSGGCQSPVVREWGRGLPAVAAGVHPVQG